MNELEKDIALLERYIENDLNAEDKEMVEQRLANEDNFEKLLNQLRVLISGIQYATRNKVMQQLKDIEQGLPEVDWQEITETEQTKTVSMGGRNYWWLAAASVVVLVVASIFIFDRGSAPEEIYTAYFQTYDNVMNATTRGEQDAKSSFERAMIAYDQGDYSLAIELFNALPSVEKDSGVYLYLGNSYLVEKKADKAIESFQKALENPGNFENQLQWYLAMGYLQAGDTDKAIEAFTVVKNGNYSKNKDADKILQELNP